MKLISSRSNYFFDFFPSDYFYNFVSLIFDSTTLLQFQQSYIQILLDKGSFAGATGRKTLFQLQVVLNL